MALPGEGGTRSTIHWRALIAVPAACVIAPTGLVAAAVGQAVPLKRIVGTESADRLRGTAKADFVHGRAGNDLLHGLAGNDRLIGGSGADRIFCGRGRDIVSADRRDSVARDCEVVRGRATPPPPPPAVVPEQLLGVWHRNVTDGRVIGADHVGVWSLRFERIGVIVVLEPPGAHPPGSGHDTITQPFSATAGGDLILASATGCPTTGTYRWELAGAVLRIQKVTDTCAPRAAVIPGDWSR